ncbi:MAG: Hsp20/alpha crystallin family protein [Candidatus Bathyarchaeia archaeon]
MGRKKKLKRHSWPKKNKRFNGDTFRMKYVKIGGSQPHKYGVLKTFTKKMMKEPAPLIDVFQNGDYITVVAELKGFRRENIKVEVEGQRLTLSAKASNRKFYKVLSLPNKVLPESLRTNYKNGVLEIRLKKALVQKINKVAG